MEWGWGRPRGTVSMKTLPLLALHVAAEYAQLDSKPPVTAGLILANTLIYLRPGPLHRLLPTVQQVCFNPHLIVKNKDLKRFILSAFYHMGESHLFYNMLSLLWKGVKLETSMGSAKFASMVMALLGMSQGITLLLSKALLVFFDYDAYYREYAVGFSGVLFAMKVVLNSQSDYYTYVHGFIVPTRYAAWAELFLIQLFVPGVSFLGHLGGVLAGILYLKLTGYYTGEDPLTTAIRSIGSLVSWPVRFIKNMVRQRQRRIIGRGRVGSSQPGGGISGVWRCPTCTYDNSGWLDVCEMCSTERTGRGFSRSQRENRSDLSLEELRQRRLQRFGR